MKLLSKKVLAIVLAAISLLAFSGCGSTSSATAQRIGSVTLSIRCDTILDNMDKLTAGKAELVPDDGCLLPETEVELLEGDTVYTLLQRYLQAQKMHYEFTGSNASAYLVGLCNLYEFDCGNLSGWEYAVNGEFPSIGLGGYTLKDRDTVEFLYTCDLGADIGDTQVPAGSETAQS